MQQKNKPLWLAAALLTFTFPAPVLVRAAYIAQGDTLLGEATVAATRPVARIKGDAIVTQVQGTPLAQAGTADDVLAHIPGLRKKSEDEGYEVVGRGTPIFFINGRQVRDVKELQQLSSDEIRAIEVITSPGARYEAGTSAVVRIRTARRKGEGLSGAALLRYEQGRYGYYTGRIDANHRRAGLDLFGTLSGLTGHWYNDSELTQETTAQNSYRQDITQRVHGSYTRYQYTLGANYDLSANSSTGVRYTYSRGAHDHGGGTLDSRVQENGVQSDRVRSFIEMYERQAPTHTLNAYYTGRIGRGELAMDADFYANGTTTFQTTQERSEASSALDREVRSENPVRNRLVAAKAVYDLPLWGGTLSAGGQYTHTNRHDAYLLPADAYGLHTARTQLKENNYAAFAEYSHALAAWQLKAGVRYEVADFNYYENGVRRPAQCRRYSDLFPSFSVSRQWGKAQLMLSYSARTQRPRYGQLTTNVTYANRYLLQTGNPLLRPTLTHDAQAVYVWRWLQAVVGFKQEHDRIIYWGTPLPDDPEVTQIKRINKSIPSALAQLTLSPTFGVYRPVLSATLLKQWLSIDSGSQHKHYDNPLAVFSLDNTLSLPHALTAMLTLRYITEGDQENAHLRGADNVQIGVTLRKAWLGDALSLSIAGEDLLRKQAGGYNKLLMGNATVEQCQGWDSRLLIVTLRYRLNPTQSKYKGGGAASDALKRL